MTQHKENEEKFTILVVGERGSGLSTLLPQSLIDTPMEIGDINKKNVFVDNTNVSVDVVNGFQQMLYSSGNLGDAIKGYKANILVFTIDMSANNRDPDKPFDDINHWLNETRIAETKLPVVILGRKTENRLLGEDFEDDVNEFLQKNELTNIKFIDRNYSSESKVENTITSEIKNKLSRDKQDKEELINTIKDCLANGSITKTEGTKDIQKIIANKEMSTDEKLAGIQVVAGRKKQPSASLFSKTDISTKKFFHILTDNINNPVKTNNELKEAYAGAPTPKSTGPAKG